MRSPIWETIGRIEYYVSVPRDILSGVIGVGMVLIGALSGPGPGHGLLLIALVLVSRQARRYANDRAIRQLSREPDAHPDDFFRTWWRALSPWPPAGEIATRRIDPNLVDFATRPISPWPFGSLLHAAFDTANLAWMILQGHKTLSQAAFVRHFDAGTRMWGLRCAWHFRLRLEIEGLENLAEVKEQAILLLNHESLLDFALGFYVLGGVKTGRGRRFRPRFLAAKDHFYDNWFLHTGLGVGRAIVASGMIFVDRSSKGSGANVVADSLETLQQHDVDLAIFPQGTRARAHFGADGKPFAAGYYTTSRDVAGRRHFRRGGAQIACGLAARRPVDVVCVGIDGTARVIPAKKMIVTTNQTVHYQFLPPIHLDQSDDVDEAALLRRIELRLRRTARVHPRLLATAARETGADEARQTLIREALTEWDDAEEPIPFAALDVILSRPPVERPALLQRFEQLALDRVDADAWDALRADVSGR